MQQAVEYHGFGTQSVREYRATMRALETCARPECVSGCTRDHDRAMQSEPTLWAFDDARRAMDARRARIARYGDHG